MLDGKCTSTLLGLGACNCSICGATPTQMSNTAECLKRPINKEALKYGCSTLHQVFMSNVGRRFKDFQLRTRDSISHSVGWSVCWSGHPSVGPGLLFLTERWSNFHYCPCPMYATDAVVCTALFFKNSWDIEAQKNSFQSETYSDSEVFLLSEVRSPFSEKK